MVTHFQYRVWGYTSIEADSSKINFSWMGIRLDTASSILYFII